MTTAPYPVRLEGELQPELSRGLWLVKWFLLIPHLIVLGLLWSALVVLTVVAFVKQLRGGRYPRRIFDFNLGVLALDLARQLLRLRRPRHRPLPALHARTGS
jgi:hypothetical protein